jgi:hypothetical protein
VAAGAPRGGAVAAAAVLASPAGLAERHPIEDAADVRARDADVAMVGCAGHFLPYMPGEPNF